MEHGGPGARGGQIMRKLSIARDFGYSTFTAGIRSGWKAELCSRKFRQVRSCLHVRVAERCAASDCHTPKPAESAPHSSAPARHNGSSIVPPSRSGCAARFIRFWLPSGIAWPPTLLPPPAASFARPSPPHRRRSSLSSLA
jgi:hypothetical protein